MRETSNGTATCRGREALRELEWHDAAELRFPPDAKKAVLFAVLANETLNGAGFRPPHAKKGAAFGFGKLQSLWFSFSPARPTSSCLTCARSSSASRVKRAASFSSPASCATWAIDEALSTAFRSA